MCPSDSFVVGVGVLIFLNALNIGHTLECYTCTGISLPLPGYSDPCKDKGQVINCGSDNTTVCVAATFISREKSSKDAQYETHKGCHHATTGGDPCQTFMASVKNTVRFNSKVEFSQQCYVCSDSRCNNLGIKLEKVVDDKDKAPTSSLSALLIVVTLLGYLCR